MTNFIYDNTSAGSAKTDLTPLPSGANSVNYVRATDFNTFLQCLTDIQTFCRGALWHGLSPDAADPAPAGVSNYLWYRSDGSLNVTGISNYVLVSSTRQIISGTGLSGGGSLAADRTLSIANTTVSPGSYTLTNLTVNQQGQITAASNGTAVTSVATTARLTGGTITTTGTLGVAGSVLLGVQVFTSSGTYNPTSGTTLVVVEIQAQGGGGGGANAAGGTVSESGGGASGVYLKFRATGSPVTGGAVTLANSGGGGGSAGNNPGTAGSDASIVINGLTILAKGGGGGGGGNQSGTIGVGTAGAYVSGSTTSNMDIGPVGTPGTQGLIFSTGGGGAGITGVGGSSPMGYSVVGANAAGFGAGGSGVQAVSGTAAGFNGSPGKIIVYEYI